MPKPLNLRPLKFKAPRPRAQVLALCRAQRVKVNDRLYKQGHDYTTLSKGGCIVVWDSFRGHFMGTTPDGVKFNSDSAEHDDQPWMQALLAFFFLP